MMTGWPFRLLPARVRPRLSLCRSEERGHTRFNCFIVVYLQRFPHPPRCSLRFVPGLEARGDALRHIFVCAVRGRWWAIIRKQRVSCVVFRTSCLPSFQTTFQWPKRSPTSLHFKIKQKENKQNKQTTQPRLCYYFFCVFHRFMRSGREGHSLRQRASRICRESLQTPQLPSSPRVVRARSQPPHAQDSLEARITSKIECLTPRPSSGWEFCT